MPNLALDTSLRKSVFGLDFKVSSSREIFPSFHTASAPAKYASHSHLPLFNPTFFNVHICQLSLKTCLKFIAESFGLNCKFNSQRLTTFFYFLFVSLSFLWESIKKTSAVSKHSKCFHGYMQMLLYKYLEYVFLRQMLKNFLISYTPYKEEKVCFHCLFAVLNYINFVGIVYNKNVYKTGYFCCCCCCCIFYIYFLLCSMGIPI